MGAKRVFPFHYAVDPELFSPVARTKVADVSYFALSSIAREEWMTKLITIPSGRLPKRRFCIAGGPFRVDLGSAKYVGDLTFSEYRNFCCSSVLCLNITSSTHASARGTSTSRPFELAALESCIISQPYLGIDIWFEPDKEITIVENEEEAIEVYEQSLNDPELAVDFGRRARVRILKDHTYRHRAVELVEHLKATK